MTAAFTTGMNILNYHFLPTGAFDANGNLALPADFAVPAGWSETVGRVTQSPDFDSLLRILGTLTVPGKDWSCWRVALNFRDGTLRVVIARDVKATGPNEQIALNWSGNLWSAVLVPLKSYAGRRKTLPPVVTDALSRVIDTVTGSAYWDRPLADEKAAQALAYNKWRVGAALGLVKAFVEFISGLTSSSKVLTTVLWYDSANPSVPAGSIRWAPLHQLYDGSGIRAVHYRWNSNWSGTPRSYPFVYGANLPRRGWGVTDVPHQPWDLARAMYPNTQWPDLDAPKTTTPAKPRCRRVRVDEGWEWVCDDMLAAPEAIDDSGYATPFAPDMPEFESVVAGGSQPVDTDTDEGPADLAAVVEPELATEPENATTRPAVLAHELPALGGLPIGAGELVDGLWVPNDDVAARVPPLIWLPANGHVAEADGEGTGWRPSGSIPTVVLAPVPGPTDQDAHENENAEQAEKGNPDERP